MRKSRTFFEKLRAKGADMYDLLERVVTAHGGFDRWKKFNRVTATVVGGGVLDSLTCRRKAKVYRSDYSIFMSCSSEGIKCPLTSRSRSRVFRAE